MCDPSDRWRHVAAGLATFEQRAQVCHPDSAHTRRRSAGLCRSSVLARTSIRPSRRPVDVDVMGERGQCRLWASRAPVLLSARVSLIRLWSSTSPPSFPRRSRVRCLLPSTGVPRVVPPLHWYCKALRLPATLPALLRFPSLSGTAAAPWSSFPAVTRRYNCGPGILTGCPNRIR